MTWARAPVELYTSRFSAGTLGPNFDGNKNLGTMAESSHRSESALLNDTNILLEQ